jgi:hypothetical protein
LPDPAQEHPWKLPSDPHPFDFTFGVIRPPGWQRIGRSLPTLAQAAPDLPFDAKKTVLLYKCFTEVFSGYPDYPAQQIGDCVSFGHAHANDCLMTVEAYLGDLPVESIRRTATEFLYGEARKVSGDLGWGDGSYGGAAVKAMTTVGMLSYGQLKDAGESDAYSGSRAKQWGRTGPPTKLEPIAADYKLGAAALLQSADDMGRAIQNGHPCTICTAHGFTEQRDADGFCRLRGRWGHCMHVTAYRADKPGFLIVQSWGPDQPSGPLALDQPSYSFWCTLEDMARIIDEGDSYALAGSPGFARKAMPSELTPDI